MSAGIFMQKMPEMYLTLDANTHTTGVSSPIGESISRSAKPTENIKSRTRTLIKWR